MPPSVRGTVAVPENTFGDITGFQSGDATPGLYVRSGKLPEPPVHGTFLNLRDVCQGGALRRAGQSAKWPARRAAARIKRPSRPGALRRRVSFVRTQGRGSIARELQARGHDGEAGQS